MRTVAGWLALLPALAWTPVAQASSQSLGCNGRLIGKGDSPITLLQACGQPIYRETLCVPMLQLGWVVAPLYRGTPSAVLASQCVPMEEWTYDRGVGNFMGIVRLYNGAIESVRDSARKP